MDESRLQVRKENRLCSVAWKVDFFATLSRGKLEESPFFKFQSTYTTHYTLSIFFMKKSYFLVNKMYVLIPGTFICQSKKYVKGEEGHNWFEG